MAPTSGKQFMRSTCFEYLVSTLNNNRCCFSASELIAALNHALPFSTTVASTTAHHLCSLNLCEPLKIDNLTLTGIRNHKGSSIKVSQDFITNCPYNICYVSLDCTIDPASINTLSPNLPFLLSFALNSHKLLNSPPPMPLRLLVFLPHLHHHRQISFNPFSMNLQPTITLLTPTKSVRKFKNLKTIKKNNVNVWKIFKKLEQLLILHPLLLPHLLLLPSPTQQLQVHYHNYNNAHINFHPCIQCTPFSKNDKILR